MLSFFKIFLKCPTPIFAGTEASDLVAEAYNQSGTAHPVAALPLITDANRTFAVDRRRSLKWMTSLELQHVRSLPGFKAYQRGVDGRIVERYKSKQN